MASRAAILNPQKPEKVMDLVGKEVRVELDGHPLLEDRVIEKCVLNYVMKGWIGVSWIYRARVHRDHIPVGNVLRVTKFVRTKEK